MKKLSLLTLFSTALLIAQETVTFSCTVDPANPDGTCTSDSGLCTGYAVFDIDTGVVETVGDTTCVVTEFTPSVSITVECQCVVQGSATTGQTNQLVYASVDNNAMEIATTGMLGTTVGTFADSEEQYMLDGETLYTNEVHITPSWCQ